MEVQAKSGRNDDDDKGEYDDGTERSVVQLGSGAGKGDTSAEACPGDCC